MRMTTTALRNAGILACVVFVASTASAQTVSTPPATLAPLAGRLYTPAIGQSNIGFYGTDLGYTVQVGNQLRILFGDSWANSSAAPVTSPAGSSVDVADDVQGWIDLNLFPSGNAVDLYVAAHPAPPGDYPWHAAAPPVTFQLNPLLTADPMTVYDGGVTGTALPTGIGRTAVAAFNNGAAVAFGLFTRNVMQPCSGGACSTGYTCDPQIGICDNVPLDSAVPCIVGSTACGTGHSCITTGGGICEDRTSSFDDGTQTGHLLSIVYQMRIANADLVIPEHWYSQVWATNKFVDASARTVNAFDPNNPALADYTPANGLNPNEKVFLWGRPSFVGAGSVGRDAELYFAYVAVPLYSSTGSFAWAPQYFTGTNAQGNPQFSPDPSRAAALNLSASPKASTETYDIVNQMGISYVPNMKKWVMFYGGDLSPTVLPFISPYNGGLAQHAPDLAIHARFASQPWGPWSAPVQVFSPGSIASPAAGSAYAELGPIYDSTCTPVTSPPCVATEAALQPPAYTYGFLYGANIIDNWTEPRGPLNQDADIYWNVSTWDPYEVLLMRTRITH
jgi:hypothetical protein